MLTFDAVNHEYRWNDPRGGYNVIPCVTQILAPLYDWSHVSPDVLEYARQVGTAIHEAIRLASSDKLEEKSIDPRIAGYFHGWRRFCYETAFQPIITEHQLYEKNLRYAGTLDVFGQINGAWCLVDYKTSASLNHEFVGAQTAAYVQLLHHNQMAPLATKRFALQLKGDGSYKLTRYTELTEDLKRFNFYRQKHEQSS